MKKITVNLKKKYDIIIKDGAVEDIYEFIKDEDFIKAAKKAVIVSDSKVGEIYADSIKKSLERAGFLVGLFCFEAGEKSKNIYTLERIYDYLYDFNITRSDFILALGGGVVGDTAGFAAATFLRGISYVQIPTSLLAQIDSSVGGKTGIDLKYGKNLVGSFYQPSMVIIDPLVLKTLDDKYFKDGMGEAIKYGCIADEELFNLLLERQPKGILSEIIERCLTIKKKIVEEDETEKSRRMLLNFGHTLGHAFEALYDFSKYSHGQAVCLGMMMIVKASVLAGILPPEAEIRLGNILKKYSLPAYDNLDKKLIIQSAFSDKKRTGNDINIVLLEKIGKAYIKKMSKIEFENFIMKVDGK